MVDVQTYVPSPAGSGTENVAVDVELESPSLECTHVHVVQYESGSVRQTEGLDVLVLTFSPEVREVHVYSVIEESCLETNLGLVVHLRLQGQVRAGVAVLESAADVLGCLEGRVDGVRGSVLTYFGEGSSQLQV